MKKLCFLSLLIYFHCLLPLAAHNKYETEHPISSEACTYLENVISILEEKSVRRHLIEWKVLKEICYEKARGAKTSGDTYKAIYHALSMLEDHHSVLLSPELVRYLDSGIRAQEAIEGIESRLLKQNIGYLSIPGFSSQCIKMQQQFALNIQQHIQALDQHNVQKWIVDLRNDTGGSIWPMVLGLRPLIGEGIFGYFTDGHKPAEAWYFKERAVYVNDDETCSLDAPSYQLHQSNLSIAVLVSENTASAGEATAIAFLGKDNVRLFGQKTAGMTTGNEEYVLSDGAMLAIATAYEADRKGRMYQDVIVPDEEIVDDGGDTILQSAMGWLESS